MDFTKITRYALDQVHSEFGLSFSQHRENPNGAWVRYEDYLRIANTGPDKVLRCAFCGHEYPEGTPTHKHESLAAHIRECEDHPIGKELRETQIALKNEQVRSAELSFSITDALELLGIEPDSCWKLQGPQLLDAIKLLAATRRTRQEDDNALFCMALRERYVVEDVELGQFVTPWEAPNGGPEIIPMVNGLPQLTDEIRTALKKSLGEKS